MYNKYSDFLLNEKIDSIKLLLEGFIGGSSEFILKMKELSKIDGNTGRIASLIIDRIIDKKFIDDSKINQNYFDLTDEDDMISFKSHSKMSKFDYVNDNELFYNDKGRNNLKIGRLIRYLATLLPQLSKFTDKDIEDFVNHFKASKSNSNIVFRIVSGDDIAKYYNSERYYSNREGQLGNSCMSYKSNRTFKIYTDNPKKVGLLIYVDENDKIHGRALIWKLKKSPCDAKYFMDRIYTNRDSDILKFKKYAEDNGFLYKAVMNSSNEESVHFKYKGGDVYGEIKVKLNGDCARYPYLDTLCFLNKDKDFLSNISYNKCYILDDTDGDCDRCYNCGGDLYDRGELCDDCSSGHVELAKMGISTDVTEKVIKGQKTNELFDSEDLKNQMEIPYLKGELDVSKWKKIELNTDNALLGSILRACPFIEVLNFRKSGSTLEIGFNSTIKYSDKDQVFYHFTVEIIKFRDGFNLNMYAKCFGNGHKIYDESVIKKDLDFNMVCSIMNSIVFMKLVDFNNYIERTFGQSHFNIKDKNNIVVNYKLN